MMTNKIKCDAHCSASASATSHKWSLSLSLSLSFSFSLSRVRHDKISFSMKTELTNLYLCSSHHHQQQQHHHHRCTGNAYVRESERENDSVRAPGIVFKPRLIFNPCVRCRCYCCCCIIHKMPFARSLSIFCVSCGFTQRHRYTTLCWFSSHRTYRSHSIAYVCFWLTLIVRRRRCGCPCFVCPNTISQKHQEFNWKTQQFCFSINNFLHYYVRSHRSERDKPHQICRSKTVNRENEKTK